MKILRNPEIAKSLLFYAVVTLVATSIAFAQSFSTGILVFSVCLFFVGAYMFSTHKRYRQIEKLSSQIDDILHGEAQTLIAEYSEGELGILQSEIQKMTVRLREQQHTLLDDKKYLADSLADISHQIKTPLTSINLLLSFLGEPNLSEERKTKYIHELYGLLSRIEWLITVLLKISKLDAGTVEFKKETIPLEMLIKRATEPLLVPIELKEQLLSVSAEGAFCGDVPWTIEAITNIIKNCMEHTPEGGTIDVTASENPIYSEIIIRDNGRGIDKNDLPHIFERFYKGKNSDGKSFGIGLALARMIVTSQGGTVKADNNISAGAKFTIRFYKRTV